MVSYQELTTMSREELLSRLEAQHGYLIESVNVYKEELNRRDNNEREKWDRILTLTNCVVAIIAAGAAVVALFI